MAKRAGRDNFAQRTLRDTKEVESRYYFIGIGVNTSVGSRLHNAVKDVENIRRILIAHYGFEEVEGFNGLFFCEENATKRNVVKNIDEFGKKGNFLRKQDFLIIYYAGHGSYSQPEGSGSTIGHWNLYREEIDIEDNSYNERYDWDEPHIVRCLEKFNCDKILIIEDRCYGGTTAQEISRWTHPHDIKERFFATLSSSSIVETVSDGRSGDNSPFAKIIIDILENSGSNEVNLSKSLLDHYAKGHGYRGDIKFRSLRAGGEISEFPLRRKNTFFCDPYKIIDNIINRPDEEDELRYQVPYLKEYLEHFPNTISRKDIESEIKSQENKAGQYRNEKIAKIIDFLLDFVYLYKFKNQVNKIIDLLLYIDGQFEESKNKLSETSLKKMNVLLKSRKNKIKIKLYETRVVKNEKIYEHSIHFGIKPVSMELLECFFLDILFEDYYETRIRPFNFQHIKENQLDKYPAINVSWFEAIQFANWLSVKEGYKKVYKIVSDTLVGVNEKANGFRLPSREELTKIAVLGLPEGARLPSMNNVWCRENAKKKLNPMRYKVDDADQLGFFDILGNIYEFCGHLDRDKEGACASLGGYYDCPLSDLFPIREYFLPPTECSISVGLRLVRYEF